MKLFRKVYILGTRYSVYRVASGENEYMEKLHYGGLCTTIDHRIYILDLSTTEEWGGETEEVRKSMEACTLRHEVTSMRCRNHRRQDTAHRCHRLP